MFIPQRLTLGQLIAELEKCDQAHSVRFDFGACVPTEVMSYRGSPYHLGIGFSHGETMGAPSVGEFVKQLRSAIGETFQGYKGGEYKMNEDSYVTVANRGDCSQTGVYGVAVADGVIMTGWAG